MEEFFSDALASAAERERANTHVQRCESCRSEVESLRAIDPLMKKVIRYRAGLAATPPARYFHFGRAAAAAATMAGVAALVLALWNPLQTAPVGPSIVENPNGIKSVGPVDPKGTDPTDINRVKSDEPDAKKPEPVEVTPFDSNEKASSFEGPAPRFVVLNAAGYERTLADYRGKTLLIGVLSAKQPQAVQNLERLYQTFGDKVRLLAVTANRKESVSTFKNTTFQILRNNGSDLLGLREADYAVVDGNGNVVKRGSLTGDSTAIVDEVSTAIKSLETK
jgi:hypothetical protein